MEMNRPIINGGLPIRSSTLHVKIGFRSYSKPPLAHSCPAPTRFRFQEQADEILKAWVDEQNIHAAGLIQELIDPVCVDGQVWTYPDHQAVMRVPSRRKEYRRMRLKSGFRICDRDSPITCYPDSICGFEVDLEAAIAVVDDYRDRNRRTTATLSRYRVPSL
jgi:hypothetical protein